MTYSFGTVSALVREVALATAVTVAVMPAQAADSEVIGPLIQTQWGQGAPYNDDIAYEVCGNNKSVLVGRMGVAMAQVMNYWQWPAEKVTGSFDCRDLSNKKVTVKVNRAVDWADIARYGADSYELCALMEMCAAASATSFSTTESVGKLRTALPRMVDNFGYSRALRFEPRMAYCESRWEELLRAELEAGRPVICQGGAAGGGSVFVIDGYDSLRGLWHINGCDGGAGDGWTETLPADIPAEDYGRYIDSQWAMMGLEPPRDGVEDVYPEAAPVLLRHIDLFKAPGDGKLSVSAFVMLNNAQAVASFEFGLRLMNNSLGMVVLREVYDEPWDLTPTTEINGFTFSVAGIETLPDGIYYAHLCWRPADGAAYAPDFTPEEDAAADPWRDASSGVEGAIICHILSGKITSAYWETDARDPTGLHPAVSPDADASVAMQPRLYTLDGRPMADSSRAAGQLCVRIIPGQPARLVRLP